MTRSIGVLGASGYTGRLVLAELAQRGIPARPGGRADVADPAFYRGLDAVISMVGPYSAAGMPIVDAAVAAGVPYVDAAAETAFVAEVLDRHADAAAPVVPACGFQGGVGDLAAAVAAEHFGGPVERVAVRYAVEHGAVSRGTVRSALGLLTDGSAAAGRRGSDGWFPGGRRAVVEVPLVDGILVRRHVPGAEVITALAVPGPVATAAPMVAGLARRLGPALERAARRLPPGPSEARRRKTTFQVVAEATGIGPRSFVLCEGRDLYGLTARLLVTAARAAARPGQPAGAMAPAEAFDAEPFLDAVAGDGFRWSFEFPEPGDLS